MEACLGSHHIARLDLLNRNVSTQRCDHRTGTETPGTGISNWAIVTDVVGLGTTCDVIHHLEDLRILFSPYHTILYRTNTEILYIVSHGGWHVADTGIELSIGSHGQHGTQPTAMIPIGVLIHGPLRCLSEDRNVQVFQIIVDEVIGKLLQLLVLDFSSLHGPTLFEHTVQVDVGHPVLNEIHYGIKEIGDVGRSQRHLGVPFFAVSTVVVIQGGHCYVVRPFPGRLDSTRIVQRFVSIDGDIERDLMGVVSEERLDIRIKVLQSVRTDGETVHGEPGMLQLITPHQKILIDLPGEIDLQQRFPTDKFNDDCWRIISVDIPILIVQQFIDELICCLEFHVHRAFVKLITVMRHHVIGDVCMARCLQVINGNLLKGKSLNGALVNILERVIIVLND